MAHESDRNCSVYDGLSPSGNGTITGVTTMVTNKIIRCIKVICSSRAGEHPNYPIHAEPQIPFLLFILSF